MAAMKTRAGRGTSPKKARAKSKASVSPVYFLSLTVENVRCFGPRQTLDLSDGEGRPARWTVILGNNGSGKTTLLQSLAAFEPELVDFTLGPKYYKPKGGSWMGVLWSPVRKDAHQARFEVRLFSGSLDGKQKSSVRHQTTHLDLEIGAQHYSFFQKPFGALICHGYGATRRMGAGTLSSRQESDGSASLFREDVPLRNAEEWLLQADYSASKAISTNKAAKARLDRVKNLLIELLPDVADIRFVVAELSGSAAQVEVKTPYGWVTLSKLSLGYRTLIAWIVDLASRMFEAHPHSSNPLAEPAVVLVDEIDLHLHPKWQRQLMSYLSERFPATQFIVTAHSPLVVQSALKANIAVLRREGDHVVIDNDVEAIQGWRVDQVLTSDLFGLESARPPQLDELLKERTRLLGKARLTKADKVRLKQLEAEVGSLPAGETRADREALDIIQSFANRVQGKDR